MGTNIAVAGGTGVLGRHVVEVARQRGHEVFTLGREDGVDLVAGTGLNGALDEVGAVIDVTSVQTQSAKRAKEFFGAVTRHLLQAEKLAGVAHHVAPSIVGVDKAPYGYYAGKSLQEQLIAAGEVPWTLQRVTQFHEFAGQIVERLRRGPVVITPRMRVQPVAAREVAERLVQLVEAGPSGRVPDFGGPREEQAVDMVRAYIAATGAKGWILPVRFPGALGQALRDGSLIPGPGSDHATQTFADWLQSGR